MEYDAAKYAYVLADRNKIEAERDEAVERYKRLFGHNVELRREIEELREPRP